MPNMQKVGLNLSFGTLGMAWLAAGLWGCDRTVDPVAQNVPAQTDLSVPASDNAISLQAHALEGEELASFLKKFDFKNVPLPATKGNSGSNALAKSAGANLCQVNFNSSKGLSHMADRAYVNYVVAPWYIEPCYPYYAQVTPNVGNQYYLTPEAKGTCPGSYGMIGYLSGNSCVNQKDAATFPRYLEKATGSDGNVAYVVSLLNPDFGSTFNASSFLARSGKMMVYGLGANGSWKTWGPIDATSSMKGVSLTGGIGLVQLGFFASTANGVYSVDNVNIYE